MKTINDSNESLLTRISGILYICCAFVAFFVSNPSYTVVYQINIFCSLFFFISGCVSICSQRNGSSALVFISLIISINSGLLVITNSYLLRIGNYSSSSYSIDECKKMMLVIEITKLICVIASTIFSFLPFLFCYRKKQDTTSKGMYRPTTAMDDEHTMQLGQQLAGVLGTGVTDGDLPRYEDVVGVEEDRVMYKASGGLEHEQMVSLDIHTGQSAAGMHNIGPGDEDLPKYEDMCRLAVDSEQVATQMGQSELGVKNNRG